MSTRGKDWCENRAALLGSSTAAEGRAARALSVSVYHMEDRVGGRGGAGDEAEAAGGSTLRDEPDEAASATAAHARSAGGGHLPAPEPQEHMQGCSSGSRQTRT